MANYSRDDFSPKTKDVLAKRVGYKCSNPSCQITTSGPHSDPNKAINVGVAAHICAAAPGGPRYDPLMTREERTSAENGIWLCQTCATLIDIDEKIYSVKTLQEWKKKAEQRAEINQTTIAKHQSWETKAIFINQSTKSLLEAHRQGNTINQNVIEQLNKQTEKILAEGKVRNASEILQVNLQELEKTYKLIIQYSADGHLHGESLKWAFSVLNRLSRSLSDNLENYLAESDRKKEVHPSTEINDAKMDISTDKEPFDNPNIKPNKKIERVENIPTLFLSYCSKDECIADLIEHTLNAETNKGIKISRYTRLPYRESFKDFMNSIQGHDYVLCVVSDSYLKSQACMYEVGEIVKDRRYKQKLLFVVLNDADRRHYPSSYTGKVTANIYGGSIKRLDYTRYWKQKYDELSKEIDILNDKEASSSAAAELKEIGRIYRNDINEFLDFLADYNGKTFEELFTNRFRDIIRFIFTKVDSPIKDTSLGEEEKQADTSSPESQMPTNNNLADDENKSNDQNNSSEETSETNRSTKTAIHAF